MKRGAVNLDMAKPGAVRGKKRGGGAVVPPPPRVKIMIASFKEIRDQSLIRNLVI